MNRLGTTDNPTHVLTLVKGGERFVFLFDNASRDEVLRQFGRFAADPDLPFTWYDAAILSQRVRGLLRDET